jgi:MarR family transcriptional regulator, negative regulator of the multidrug operon emrRAB
MNERLVMDRLGNLLNATSIAISDAQTAEVLKVSGVKPSATATVFTLGQHGGQTIAELASTVGISHSAMVRLIDNLEGQGLVLRASGRDRREIATALTETGDDLYRRLREAQQRVLDPLLEGLSSSEREALGGILSRVLEALTKSPESGDRICRFCDEQACPQASCPVEVRARQLAS